MSVRAIEMNLNESMVVALVGWAVVVVGTLAEMRMIVCLGAAVMLVGILVALRR